MSDEYLMAAINCLDTQLKIGNPIIGSSNTEYAMKDEQVAQVVDIPGIGFYIVNFQMKASYPDAPVSSCRVLKDTGVVLSASYHTGEPTADFKEIVFVQHDPMEGLSEQDLDLLVEKQEITEFPMIMLLNN